jgi:hypothetical protein
MGVSFRDLKAWWWRFQTKTEANVYPISAALVFQLLTLKAWEFSAQGNALGNRDEPMDSQPEVKGWDTATPDRGLLSQPFRLKKTTRGHWTQGVALG